MVAPRGRYYSPGMHAHPETIAIVAAIREARFIHGVTCVHCDARCIQRWGTFSGRQRYRCGSCLRTFSDLTNTAAYYLKKVQLLKAYVRCLPEARSVRYEGRRMQIDKDTALRWRHRLLGSVPEHGELLTVGISGIVEVAESAFNCVRRRRAQRWDPWRPPPLTIVVLRDRRRLTYQQRCAVQRVTSHEFEAVSVMINRGATVVTAAGHLGPVATAVRRRRLAGIDLHFRRGGREAPPHTRLHHTRNVLEFIRREKRWLKRFRGVSPRWIEVYLSWFELVDPTTRAPAFEELLMWPVLLEVGNRPPSTNSSRGRSQNGFGEEGSPDRTCLLESRMR